jgi:citrate synthase
MVMPLEYWTAKQSADFMGVSLPTLYAYVSRKGVRSAPMPGSREHRYLRADIEGIRKRKRPSKTVERDVAQESSITLITEDGPYYRGKLATELAVTDSLESVAALLWNAQEPIFASAPPIAPKIAGRLIRQLADARAVSRALALFPFLESSDRRAFDMSPAGMARTGAGIMLWLTAIMLGLPTPRQEPIDVQFAGVLRLRPDMQDLLRRLLVMSADHGFEEATDAVRAVAATGVTPWRTVATGLSVVTGRASKYDRNYALQRLIDEILVSDDAAQPILRRIGDREEIPGFASDVYPAGDPRARFMFDSCDEVLANDKDYRRLKQALDAARDYRNLRPNFAMAIMFIDLKLGLGPLAKAGITDTPFIVGRATGWIAHGIEQYARGEAVRRSLDYRGPLPQPT